MRGVADASRLLLFGNYLSSRHARHNLWVQTDLVSGSIVIDLDIECQRVTATPPTTESEYQATQLVARYRCCQG